MIKICAVLRRLEVKEVNTPTNLHTDYFVASPMATDSGPANGLAENRWWCGTQDPKVLDNLLATGANSPNILLLPPDMAALAGAGSTGTKTWDPGIPVAPGDILEPGVAKDPFNESPLHTRIPRALFDLMNSGQVSETTQKFFTSFLRTLKVREETRTEHPSFPELETGVGSPVPPPPPAPPPTSPVTSPTSAADRTLVKESPSDNPRVAAVMAAIAPAGIDPGVEGIASGYQNRPMAATLYDNGPKPATWNLFLGDSNDVLQPGATPDPKRPSAKPQVPMEFFQLVDAGKVSDELSVWFMQALDTVGYLRAPM